MRVPFVLAGGFALVCVLTLSDLLRESWSHEFGAYGPIILVAGAWLLWRRWSEMRRDGQPGALWLGLAMLIPSLLVFMAGHALDYPTFAALGVWGAGVSILYMEFGRRILMREWFPVLFLLLAAPPPGVLLSVVTKPLKQFVTSASVQALQPFGIPVSHQGVIIDVAQYQLLVEDACSGLNSIVGLTAVTLLYIYLLRAAKIWYAVFLTAFVIPIAILANIARIVVLILLTYFAGNAVAQGYLHFTAGLLLFSTALLLVFGLDSLAATVGARFAARRRLVVGSR